MEKDYWQNKKVLVTGANGFIGRFLIKELSDKGAKVLCFSGKRQNIGDIEKLKNNCKITYEDLLNLDRIEELIEDFNPSHIFHLASQSLIQKSLEKPSETLNFNIRSTINLLEAARKNNKIEAIIVVSSIGAYDPLGILPFKEDSPLKGQSPYDVSKSCIDLISQSYAKTYNLPINIVRFSNIFGEQDINFERLVPRTIKNLIEGKEISLRHNGMPLRGFFYVHDAVSGLITLATKTKPLELKGEAFNFGPDNPISIKNLIDKIILLSGVKNYNIYMDNEGLNEVKDQYHSNSKAKAILNWKNNYTLDDALIRTIDWYREYLKT